MSSWIARNTRRWSIFVLALVAIVGACLSRGTWLPWAEQVRMRLVAQWRPTSKPTGDSAASEQDDDHVGDHQIDEEGHEDHESHDDHDDILELSPQALANLGLTSEHIRPVALETFHKSTTAPAMVIEKPGRSRMEVSTPMAGVITKVHAVQGEAVAPGALLFELRITAEEFVATQAELLKTVGELEVEHREIARLESVTASGAIPQKSLLERQYAKDRLEVAIATQREALRLHGLSERQIKDIEEKRRLLRNLQVLAPTDRRSADEEIRITMSPASSVSFREGTASDDAEESERFLILQNVPVHVGETVKDGASLATLVDFQELYIEGKLFEQDALLLGRAVSNGWKVSALFDQAEGGRNEVHDLDIVYSSSVVNVESRTLAFYVRLPNEVVHSAPTANGHHFVEWKYRPGQRLQLRVPLEEMKDQIVIPIEGVAQEGAEYFVFKKDSDHFVRVPVHVTHKDPTQVVIANDGALPPGAIVAMRGAHQMQMALKNQAGGGMDPHADHEH